MKTEITIFNLSGNKRAIRQYAENIACLSPGSSNAYAMAFDKNNEPIWTVQAGDQYAAMTISWKGVCRVEIYDHSVDKKNKYEQAYLTSQKQMNEYILEREKAKKAGAEYTIAANNTQYHVLGGRI